MALGFVRDLEVVGGSKADGQIKFSLCLTTPACPFKGQLEKEAEAVVRELPWVKEVRDC